MEYVNVVWGGGGGVTCTYNSDILKCEKIPINGMRLVTGATTQRNIMTLYSDTAWQPISE